MLLSVLDGLGDYLYVIKSLKWCCECFSFYLLFHKWAFVLKVPP